MYVDDSRGLNKQNILLKSLSFGSFSFCQESLCSHDHFVPGVPTSNEKVTILQSNLHFFISVERLTPGLLTWEQQVDSAALAPVSSGTTSLVEAITFGQPVFHMGSTGSNVCN